MALTSCLSRIAPPTISARAGAKSATIALAIAACLGGAHAQTVLGTTTTYNSTTDVTAQLAVGDAIAAMKKKIDSGNRTGAVTDYGTSNVKSLFDATSGATKELFLKEFGTAFVDGALTAAEESALVIAAAKNEIVEKTLMDMVVMHLVIDKITNSLTTADWDEAAAFYIGSSAGFTTYDRAEKRGDDFGTNNANGEAKINAEIITALNTPSIENRAKIIQLYQVLYSQNVLKYAFEIDAQLAEADVPGLSEIVGEGLAFWRVLKPWLKARDAPGAAILDAMFDLKRVPDSGKPTVQGVRHWNYCRAKTIVDAHVTTLTGVGVGVGAYSEVATDFTCPTTLPSGFGEPAAEYTVGGVTYTFKSDIGASLQFSEAIASIRRSLASGTMADVKAGYEDYGLRGLSDLPRSGDAYVLFTGSDGYNDPLWISKLMAKVFTTPNLYVPEMSARSEIIEKTLMDALAVQCILDDLWHAQVTKHDADSKRAFIDHAAAKFLGTKNARGSTVYERGNKRGVNFGTASADGVSHASLAILTALKEAAAVTGNTPAADTTRAAKIAVVTRHIKVIYAQATLRYAKIVGDDLADNNPYAEHQAEGMAFLNVIYPWVKAIVSPANLQVLVNFYDVVATPESFNDFAYCKAKSAMEQFLGSDAVLLGTLETAKDITCAAALPSGATGVVTAAGTYTPVADIGASLSFSVAVMRTLDLLEEPPFASVLATFEETGLAGLADRNRAGEPVYDLFRAHFGADDWMTAYIEAAADNEKTPTTNAEARREMIEKTVRDAVATQAILSDLYRGAQGFTAAHKWYWDRGAAKYFGTNAERSVTVYNRADKRAANFGTFETDGRTAKANAIVLTALNAGRGASTKQARLAQYEIVKKQILVVYSQCVLRYANYLDIAFLDGTAYAEWQAEGQAFLRVISPFIKERNPNGATYLDGVFSLSREVAERTHYCRARSIIADLGVTSTEIGALEDLRNGNCDGVSVPEDATSYLAAGTANSGSSRTFAATSIAVGVALALAF